LLIGPRISLVWQVGNIDIIFLLSSFFLFILVSEGFLIEYCFLTGFFFRSGSLASAPNCDCGLAQAMMDSIDEVTFYSMITFARTL